MFKRFFSSLVLVATVVLYGCGGGGGGGGSSSGGLVQLVSITVTPDSPSIAVGTTQQLSAMGTYTDNSTQDLSASVTWDSSNKSIATITSGGTSGGIASAVALGSTTITATSGAITSSPVTLTVEAQKTATTIAGLSGTSGLAVAGPVAGSVARFNNPDGITAFGTDLYVADTFNRAIRKITASGDVTTIATLGATGPIAITTDGTNLYVAESLNNTIRKIVISTGTPTILAGSGTAGFAEGTGAAAQFNSPRGVTIDADGIFLYVADYGNNSIRKIDLGTGTVSTVVQFFNPRGITIHEGNLYVTDDANHVITRIAISSGISTVIAGSSGVSGFRNGTGTTALFNKPWGITTDGTYLYVADSDNLSIRKIEISTGTVTSVITQQSNIKPLGITMIGTILYATNTDQTIKKFQ